ncbi:MAG: sulfur carrier protein ThiS [Gammaproteobacteria bacterium]|nr:sulfur carrier protein ThiS [Gammaproteobacteria bacterium]
MRIRVNGELTELGGLDDENPRLDRVLVGLGYQGRKVAVAVNETFVPRAAWAERAIESGDRLDVVAPIQGG